MRSIDTDIFNKYLTRDGSTMRSDPKQHQRNEEEGGGVCVLGGGGSVYFFLLNRLKRFSLSFSRLPGLDSGAGVAATATATEAGSV